MKQERKLIIIIGVVILIICIICAVLLVYLNKDKSNLSEMQKYIEMGENPSEGDEVIIEYNLEKLKDPTKFFSVENCIKNNIDSNFVAEDMNILNTERIASYAVKGRIGENTEEIYFIVRVDNENNTYTMEKAENVSDINNIDLETDIMEINDNGNNTFEYNNITTEEMCKKYLKDFTQKELNNPEEAYAMLDEEYKSERFSGIEEYQEYIELCRNRIQYATLSKYSVEIKDNYTEYILVDNYNNSYTVRATGIWDYTILLDNYTIKVDTYEEEYNKQSTEQKIQANVYIFLQMINTKDYRHAYELLDETFKNNNFDTLDKFKKYINGNFFDYNLNTTSNVDISNEGSTYIYETVIRSGAGSAAETKNLTVIMQLKEGTDFVMSFSLE